MVIRDSGELWDGQPVLCQQEVMLVKGVLFVRGVLTLTSEELSFCPIRVIDKLAGAQEGEISYFGTRRNPVTAQLFLSDESLRPT